MGYLAEKVAYLRGLAEGMKVGEDTAEGKMIVKILEALEEISESIEDLSEEITETEERIDDLEDFADEVFEILYDDECDCDECGCDCDDCDCDDEYDYLDEYEDDDTEFYEVVCPECEEKVYFDEDMVDGENLYCPNCKSEIHLGD